ncbi:MAG: small-conductance mechanosensitive channel [Psychrobacter glaciei]|jgi:small-conductance mechanosensitive channel
MENAVLQQFLSLFSFSTLFSIGYTIAFIWVLLALLRWGINTLVNYQPKYRIQLAQIYPVLRITAWLLALIYIIIGIIQPPQSVIYASLGSLGLAVGLASQDAIKNLVAGIMMAISPRYKIGDMIQIGDHYGEVTSLDLSTTKLRTFNDSLVTVPNGDMLKMPISNSNSGELNELVAIELHLPVNIPIAKLKNIVLSAAKCSHYVFLKKPIAATITPVFERDFYYKVTVKAYVIDVRLEKSMATDISERVIELLDDNNLLSNTAFNTNQPE